MLEVEYEVIESVARVWLNRPKRSNSLNSAVISGLRDALRQAAADASVRVVVLGGRGRAFCSGMDLAGKGVDPQQASENAIELFETVRQFPKPLVGRIHGPVLGGGLGLLFACDVCVASKNAYLSFAEVRRGIVPAVISTLIVPQLGPAQSRELMLLGSRVPAHEAVARGIIQKCVDSEEDLDRAIADVVAALLAGGPRAQAAIKKLVDFTSTHSRPENLDYARQAFKDMMASDEAHIGISAFMQKQQPNWSGFSSRL